MAPIISQRDSTRITQSFYQKLRENDDHSPEIPSDEENLLQQLHGIDQGQIDALMADSRGSSNIILPNSIRRESINRDRASPWSPRHEGDIYGDVPASLLVEARSLEAAGPDGFVPYVLGQRNEFSVAPARSDDPDMATTQQPGLGRRQYHLHVADVDPDIRHGAYHAKSASDMDVMREQALWQWVNTTNLDRFVNQVYQYYRGSGLWCITCSRALHLCETTFMAILATFIFQCVDYSKLHGSHSLSQVIVPQCTTSMSAAWSAGVWAYIFYFIWKCVQFALDLRRLWQMRAFFTYLLGIPEHDMQTISWQDIVARIMALRDANPQTAINMAPRIRRFLGSQSKKRLDAHDIANRLMRKDNYLIAMINKDVLDFSLPLPLLKDHMFFSPTLEWLIQFSILDFIFSADGQVQQEFLKSSRRRLLSEKLRQRFIFAGLLNLACAPFVMTYMIVRWISEYYQEYQKNPSVLGTRRYTPLAEWRFREFNELEHLFQERIKMSYPFAHRYVTQFPKQLTEQIARTIMFVAGALVAGLAALTIHDAEFLNFEITPDRTALFYLTLLGGIWAAARGSVPEDTDVFNPEYALNNVIEYTRYLPERWKGRLHGAEVLREFSSLYRLKWAVLLEELLGAITAPCVMLFSMPKCSDSIIDFFREFTVHVDGLGYVCSFAVFDFQKATGDTAQQVAHHDVRENYYSTKHGKMAASFYGFMDNYVVNPKTGVSGIAGASVSPDNFHLPPTFPPLSSPHLTEGTFGPRTGPVSSKGRDSIKGLDNLSGVIGHTTGPPRRPGDLAQPSPLASLLLDPHHQPSAEVCSMYRSRQPRAPGTYPNMLAQTGVRFGMKEFRSPEVDDPYESSGLGESVWETSLASTLPREPGDTTPNGESEAGVLGLIYQLQRARRPQRGA
jgi:autophagy-related protein 9